VKRASVLLLGATGFIGGRLRAALQNTGYDVICGVRRGRAPAGCRSVEIDYTRDHAAADWMPRLAGVDVVVNAIGILRERGGATFEAVHVQAPVALFTACVEAKVRKVVQISALGADGHAVSRYHRSKKQADDSLAALPIPSVIVQPSLVFGDDGRSARLFCALAALPVVPVPGAGEQQVQPIHVDDLCEGIMRLVASDAQDRQHIAAVGPEPLTLRHFLARLRHALGLGRARFVPVPMWLMRIAARVCARLPRALLDSESLAMLVRGNVASSAAIAAVLGRPPRPVEAFVRREHASALATQARLAWLLPLVRASVAIVWIAAGVLSLGLYPVAESYAMLARVGLTGVAATLALYGAAALDLAFGIAIFVVRDRRWLWRAQMLLIAAYSVIIAVCLPDYWLHPFGPVVKNLPMLAAIALLHELEPRHS